MESIVSDEFQVYIKKIGDRYEVSLRQGDKMVVRCWIYGDERGRATRIVSTTFTDIVSAFLGEAIGKFVTEES